MSCLIIVCSFFGLPWFVAATVLSINHVNSLKKESQCSAPGEQPKFLGVRCLCRTWLAVLSPRYVLLLVLWTVRCLIVLLITDDTLHLCCVEIVTAMTTFRWLGHFHRDDGSCRCSMAVGRGFFSISHRIRYLDYCCPPFWNRCAPSRETSCQGLCFAALHRLIDMLVEIKTIQADVEQHWMCHRYLPLR